MSLTTRLRVWCRLSSGERADAITAADREEQQGQHGNVHDATERPAPPRVSPFHLAHRSGE